MTEYNTTEDNVCAQIRKFLKEAAIRFDNKYCYRIEHIAGSTFIVEVTCPIHGVFYMSRLEHSEYSSGCLQCDCANKHNVANTTTITTDISTPPIKATKKINLHYLEKRKLRFINNARLKFGDKFKYHMEDYAGTKSKIRIECPKHGLFSMSPYYHLQYKTGCGVCSKSEYKPSTTRFNQFLKRCRTRYGDKYTYCEEDYINAHSKIIVICPKHGKFRTTPNIHLNSKYGCPKCAKEG